ncbi:MAG: hypothetical protein ACI4MP_03805 [Candidatus Ventricola sp.]
MAEYAQGRRCVRTAARGFSPDRIAGMPRAEARHGLLFQFMLESRRRLSPAASAWRRAANASGFRLEEVPAAEANRHAALRLETAEEFT